MTTLSQGSVGQAVTRLQKQLNAHGAQLLSDGDFGAETDKALRAYQRKVGLVADGIAGPKTFAALNGADCSRLLQNATLVAAAKRLGVELAVVYAVNEVESTGQGFLDNGKPKILFERHVLYRLLCTPNQGDDATTLKQHADALAQLHPQLVNPKRGGYHGGSAEWQRLSMARLLDCTLADQATSWGAFQIMGYHWQTLGYASPAEFVAAMHHNENAQFEAFVRFIEAHPSLHKALKGKKWAQFAKGYNGPAYAQNLYDAKLERAYERHASCGCKAAA